MTLPEVFLIRPLAHRGLHGPCVPENSFAAFKAAIAGGYGIELDVQVSSDGVAMVFHDDTLDRMTPKTGQVNACTAEELGQTALPDGSCIPTLAEVLAKVNGRVPLLIEIKDQDGALGPNIGALEAGTAAALQGYDGPVALMSFNPHAVARMAELSPEIPRGLTTCDFSDWAGIPLDRRAALTEIPDLDRVGGCFISHDRADLRRARVAELAARGLSVLCWTIRSAQEEAIARNTAHNITFEGYLAATP